jgi:hypothetical protein
VPAIKQITESTNDGMCGQVQNDEEGVPPKSNTFLLYTNPNIQGRAHNSLAENSLIKQDMPGFGPAAEPLFFREKWPKPMTPRPALGERADASLKRAVQLAGLKQGPPAEESVPPLVQPAGVGQEQKP